MSDPAAGGHFVPAGDGVAWANGGPRFGDMVWGKVKSHPWWPGHIYSITLTDDPEVHRGHREGLILVAFFGDSSYGWFEPHELVPFEDHFAEKAAQGGSSRSSFAAAVAEAVDEVARRGALAMLCPCRKPDAIRPHPSDSRFLLVDVPGFDSDADYHPDQISAARERFVPRKALDHLLEAAVEQRDAAEAAAKTLQGIEMAGMFVAFRRARFAARDTTYAEAFGVDPEKALAAEEKAAAERAQRARPLKGQRKTPEQAAAGPGRRRGSTASAAARLMEKIVPGASAMKAKASKKEKDQYVLKRRDPPASPSLPEPATLRPAPLPDAYPPMPALDDGPPGFPADPPTPPLPGSSVEDEDFMLQRRALPPLEAPPAAQPTAAAAAVTVPVAAPDAERKNATKPKKAPKRQRADAADSGPGGAAVAGEPPKKKKKKKLSELAGGAPQTAPSAAAGSSNGSGKPTAFPPPKVMADLDSLDLKQVVSDLRNLPLVPDYGVERRMSDAALSFVLAFRSKYYKKSFENSPEEGKKGLESLVAAADDQPAKKKKPAVRPGAGTDPTTNAGVKRGPSDRQEELAVKKKAKLEKIKTLANEKKDAIAVAANAARQGMKEKAEAVAVRRREPAPVPRMRTLSPRALIMKYPPNSTLPSVAELKARFARFGPLDVDGIRVFWKSHSCRVVYRFRDDADAALKYAKTNSMSSQAGIQFSTRDLDSLAGEAPPAAAADAPPQRSDLRLMETTQFRPGSSGNGAPLALSRAVPARAAVGQQPKSILKKSADDGAARGEASRVKFVADGGDSKVDSPAPPAAGKDVTAAASTSRDPRSVAFPPQQPLQPPLRPLQPPMRSTSQPLQPPRVAASLPPPPPQQHLPYPPRHTDGLASFSGQPPTLPYPPRQGEQQAPLPYPPHPGQQQQQVAPQLPGSNGEDIPEWKKSKEAFKAEVWRLMTGIQKMVDPLTDKETGYFPYHLFKRD